MSLIVTIEETREPEVQDAQWSAGVEAARESLWGHAAVRGLGATFLPQLADDNVYVCPDEIDAFEQECRHLLAHARSIAVQTGYGQGGAVVPTGGGLLFIGQFEGALEGVRVPSGDASVGEGLITGYLRNMLEACRVARACGGAIWIS